jgi:hypothetical protein
VRIAIEVNLAENEAEGEEKRIAVHLRGGEVIEFSVDLDEWADGFDRAHRKRRGIQIVDSNHGGRLGINPQHVLYWKTVRPTPETH